MKASLNFNLPEDQADLKLILRAESLLMIIRDMDKFLSNGHPTALEKLHEYASEYDINIWG